MLSGTSIKQIFLGLLILLLIGMALPACAGKPARKNVSVLKLGDPKELAIDLWGEPDAIKLSSDTESGRELWVYECTQFFDCSDNNCFSVTPCYYLYFENNAIVSIYDAVVW